jgi:hypothetical protein
MGNFIAKSTTNANQDIYITCLDKMEQGLATPVYHTSTCTNCKFNIHHNFHTNNLIHKNSCFNCETNYKSDYIIDILPMVPISS